MSFRQSRLGAIH